MMRAGRTWRFLSCVGAAVAAASYGVALYAQTVAAGVPAPGHVAAEIAARTTLTLAGGEMERIVKGAPFSAQATSTTTQVLADGNKIVQTSEMSLARDSEGRTRREMSVEKIGPWSTDTNGRMVFIRDPVALVTYVLMPDGKNATKSALHMPPGWAAEREARLKSELDAQETHARTRSVRVESIHGETRSVTYNGQPLEVGAMILGGPEEGTENKESLGEQNIEGVRAQGTRVTRTIPAGRIGNERAIEIVSETWYSPDLQLVLQSRHSDPRIGETIYKLTNVVLTEPDGSLFQVPASYTVQEEKLDMMRFHVREPPPPPPPAPPQQ